MDAVFIGTTSSHYTTSRKHLKDYFRSVVVQRKPIGAELLELDVLNLQSSVIVVTAMDRLSWIGESAPTVSYGRVTMVLVAYGLEWKIMHFHRSEVPAMQAVRGNP